MLLSRPPAPGDMLIHTSFQPEMSSFGEVHFRAMDNEDGFFICVQLGADAELNLRGNELSFAPASWEYAPYTPHLPMRRRVAHAAVAPATCRARLGSAVEPAVV